MIFIIRGVFHEVRLFESPNSYLSRYLVLGSNYIFPIQSTWHGTGGHACTDSNHDHLISDY